jgi:hypothetical protein
MRRQRPETSGKARPGRAWRVGRVVRRQAGSELRARQSDELVFLRKLPE